MITKESSLGENSNEEIPALIETLLATEQRLEDLTEGQVDSVAGRDGRTFVLRRAQDQLRHNEALKQAAILNALPAHIALLDGQGFIISVNEAWRRFAEANALNAPDDGIGLNYLAICEQAQGDYSVGAHQVAAGIRSVLARRERSFSFEYSCDSATEPHWFQLTVSPLAQDNPNGVVIMHLNITERKLARTALEELSQKTDQRERMLTTMLSNLHDFAYIYDRDGCFLFANQPLLDLWGLPLDEVVGKNFHQLGYPDDLAQRLQRELTEVFETGKIVTGETPYLSPAGVQGIYEYIFSPAVTAQGGVEFVVGSTRDITERKRIEDALRMSEERLRAALKASRTGTFRWEFHTNELSWDESLDALFGIPKGQAIRSLDTFIATVHPDDRLDVIERCERCARDGADFDMEFRVLWSDGSLHWLDDKGKTFFDAAGMPIYMTGACVDITERKLAEMALRESETEFRALAEAMPHMVWITRPDGWNVYISQQWVSYTGITIEESLGHGWIKPFHPEDRERSWAAWQHATSTAGVYSIESRLRRADGVYRWWLIRGVPQTDSEGNILKWFGTCTDIHDMKQAELEISRTNEALQESNEKFHQLANTISDVFWIMSPDFNTIHYVSPGYDLIWGHSAASLYANPHQWIETIIPEERDGVLAVFETLMEATPEISVEYRIARPDGSVRWIHDRGFQVRDAAGKLVRLTGFSSDITERKALEAQLRQAQKMEAIGTLAGGIAHDFNNILAAIMGYTEIAQKRISAGGRPHSQLEQVLKASGRARDLVQQILTFSRREEHAQHPIRVQDIVEETLDLIRSTLPATIEIQRTIDPAVPWIMGDATQIQQVIMNLCVNAGHAMKEATGILSISVTSPDIGADLRVAHPELREGRHVLLSISDTGCGIDKAIQTRIFDPFYTTKAPGEGTGLGLAVVHGVVKNHDGVITVESEVGAGTTFSIYLPVCASPADAVAPEAVNIPRGNGEHILFVDDEEALASLGKLMLEEIGYRVTAKTDSVEALEVFRSQPEEFDLVVTDQTMPDLNGADFAKALLEIRPTLPVILLTGYSTSMSPEVAKTIGIRELLLKPCPMDVLGEALKAALENAERRNPIGQQYPH